MFILIGTIGVLWCLIFIGFYFYDNYYSSNIFKLADNVKKLNNVQFPANSLLDEIKNLETAYARNPKAFNYDINYIKTARKEIENIEERLYYVIPKIINLLQQKIENKKNKSYIYCIGFIGIIIMNIAIFF